MIFVGGVILKNWVVVGFGGNTFLGLGRASSGRFTGALVPFFISNRRVVSACGNLESKIIFAGGQMVTVGIRNVANDGGSFASLPCTGVRTFSIRATKFCRGRVTVGNSARLRLCFSKLKGVGFRFRGGTSVVGVYGIVSGCML